MAHHETPTQSALDKSAFAVCSRLISCLVTESLLRALYLPLNQCSSMAGLLVVLSSTINPEQTIAGLQAEDIIAIVPLRNTPVLKPAGSSSLPGSLVALLDPLDMLSKIYEPAGPATGEELATISIDGQNVFSSITAPPSIRFSQVKTPESLWRKVANSSRVKDSIRISIEKELTNSYHWQALSYTKPPACPHLSSASIEWEQSLVEGHPTHPMHRARIVPVDLPDGYDWYHPLIRFVQVPRVCLHILGPFETEIRTLANKAAEKVGKCIIVDNDRVIMPIHELQAPFIVSKFKQAELLDADINVCAQAQSSIRTVVIPELPGKALKLSVNVRISSSLRTISHYTANFGPRFSQNIIPKLSFDPKILTVEMETASAVFCGVEPDLAKHFTAIIRQQYVPPDGEAVIVCAALLENGHSGVPEGISAVEYVFNLDTQHKRATFVDRYIRLACEALVPPLVYNGVAFEAHAQNTLARFDVRTGELHGFVIRDLGGLRIHPDTLRRSTGTDFEFLDRHCVVTDTVEEIYPKFYHTLVHNHLQRLIRVLGMHYDGSGYAILRRHLEALIPMDHHLRREWLSPNSYTVPGKCLMRMRMEEVYRDMIYEPFPNMILFDPTNNERSVGPIQ